MNSGALRVLLRSAKQRIEAIDADLERSAALAGWPSTHHEFYHQGYQFGRKAELESLAAVLETALAVDGVDGVSS